MSEHESVARRMSLRKRLVSGGIWVVGARFFGLFSTVLINVLLARKLKPEDFGDFVVLCSITNAASQIAIFGMNFGVVRFVAEQLAHEKRAGARCVLERSFRLSAFAASATSVTVLVGIFIAGSRFLSLQQPTHVALIAACTLAIQAFSNLNAAALRGLGEMRYSSIIGGQGGVVGPMASTLFLIFVAALIRRTEFSLVMTLFAYAAALAIALVIGRLWLNRTVSSVLGPRELEPQTTSDGTLDSRSILFACLPMLCVQILSTVTKQGGLWVAGATCLPQELALYAAAIRAITLVALPLTLVNLSVMAVIPQLRTQGRLPELERILQVAGGWAAIPSFLALLLFVLAPAPFLELFLGANYRNAAGLLSILSLGQFVMVWVGLAELTLVLSGHARSAAVVNAITACLILGGGPLIARIYGATGLAFFATSVIAGQSLAQWLLTRHLLGIWTNALLFPWRIAKGRR